MRRMRMFFLVRIEFLFVSKVVNSRSEGSLRSGSYLGWGFERIRII
jgi:hypothetical protein